MNKMKFSYNGLLRVLDAATVRKFHSQSTGQWIVNGFDVVKNQYRSFFAKKIRKYNP